MVPLRKKVLKYGTPKPSYCQWVGRAYLPKGPTWRFMGSYKWGYKSPNKGYKFISIATLLITHL